MKRRQFRFNLGKSSQQLWQLIFRQGYAIHNSRYRVKILFKILPVLLFICVFILTGNWPLVAAFHPSGMPEISPGNGGENSPKTLPFIHSQPESLAQNPQTPGAPSEAPKSFADIIAGTQKMGGLFTLYRDSNKQKLYLEIKPEQLNKNFLCFITLSSGLGEIGLIRGLPLGDFLFQLRHQQNQIQFVIPNINFRTNPDDPQLASINHSFSESILYTLPIESTHPQTQSLLIDLGQLLMGKQDLPGLSVILPTILGASYGVDPTQSYFSEAKVFPLNVEIESVYRFFGDEGIFQHLPTLPDSRAFNLRVHYSLSEVPANNSYRPRLADERIGYFLTAYQDFSDDNRSDPFVRYINRWNLVKKDPTAPLSPPVEPIVFWIENTVPVEYREAIQEGVLLWNKAFEKAGFIDAIQVKQMPKKADWDPADVRYNTIRWSTSFESRFAGIGPSRINPLTGEILDADIVLDGNIVRSMKHGYRTLIEQNQGMTNLFKTSRGEPYNPCRWENANTAVGENAFQSLTSNGFGELYLNSRGTLLAKLMSSEHLCFGWESSQQMAVGAIALSLLQNIPQNSRAMDQYVHEYLRYLTAHEVGHTLGLRHNFHGSTLLTPEELNNPAITHVKGLTGSVMDYVPVNLALHGTPQGDYFSATIGPYDQWAIEYGYTPILGNNDTNRVLEAIASRAPNPDLSYATDEDSVYTLDPAVNTFDLSRDILGYSRIQLENARAMWSRLEGLSPRDGESYSEMRLIFDAILEYYFRNIYNTTLHIGGQSFNRDHVGDPNGRLPFEPIPLERQRQALKLIEEYVFAPDAFGFSPDLLNKLAPSRWNDWGNSPLVYPLNYPIQERIQRLQRFALESLLSNVRLSRLVDLELKAKPENVLTLPELFETLQKSIWTEVLASSDEVVEIGNIRRSLQREHLTILTDIVLRNREVPEDSRTLAWYQLRQLREALTKTLRQQGDKLDAYSRAHLEETQDRVLKVLNSELLSN